MKDLSLGQYYPVKSPVHRMDARMKIVITVAYITMLFFIPTLSAYMKKGGTKDEYLLTAGICYGLALLFVLAGVSLSRVPFLRLLKSMRALIFLIVFMSLTTLFFYGGPKEAGTWTWKWKFLSLSTESIINSSAMVLRMVFLFLGPMLLTLTTTPVEFTDGIESLLKPLKLIRFPVHVLAMIMSLALRLIPTLAEETQKIIGAQKARGADFDSKNIFKKAKALMPVLIPLFISAFKRAEDLADAMNARCYRGAKGRTRMKVFRLHLRDFAAFLVFSALFFAILTLKYNWFGFADSVIKTVF